MVSQKYHSLLLSALFGFISLSGLQSNIKKPTYSFEILKVSGDTLILEIQPVVLEEHEFDYKKATTNRLFCQFGPMRVPMHAKNVAISKSCHFLIERILRSNPDWRVEVNCLEKKELKTQEQPYAYENLVIFRQSNLHWEQWNTIFQIWRRLQLQICRLTAWSKNKPELWEKIVLVMWSIKHVQNFQ